MPVGRDLDGVGVTPVDDVGMNIIPGAIGGQVGDVVVRAVVTPFIGADILMNLILGSKTFQFPEIADDLSRRSFGGPVVHDTHGGIQALQQPWVIGNVQSMMCHLVDVHLWNKDVGIGQTEFGVPSQVASVIESKVSPSQYPSRAVGIVGAVPIFQDLILAASPAIGLGMPRRVRPDFLSGDHAGEL